MTMHVPFVEAKFFGNTPKRHIDVIVIHDMEMPEKGDTAETCARYFQHPAVPSSAHYCVDVNSIVQSVRDHNIAYAAPGANLHGLHIEHAGYARQSRLQWRDPYSKKMLKRSAALAAVKAKQYGIPIKWLSPEDLRAGKRGFTSHANVSAAFRQSTHTDPGPHFPVGLYLTYVRILTNPVHQEDIVLDADIQKIADAVWARIQAHPDFFTDKARRALDAEAAPGGSNQPPPSPAKVADAVASKLGDKLKG